MAERGYRITVFTPHLPVSAATCEKEKEGINVIRFPAFEIIPNFPLPKWWDLSYWQQRRKTLDKRPDIVLSRTRFFLTSFMALWYAKTRRIPLVHVEHGSDYVKLNNPFFKMCARLYDYTVGRLVVSFANHVIANSKASAVFVRRLVPWRNPVVIYRGVRQEFIEQADSDNEIRRRYGNQIIVYAGRLIDGKGVPDLIHAVGKLPSASCIIVGGGPQQKELELLVRSLHLSDRIAFVGHKTPKELFSILKSVDVMVNPSYTEGLPTAVIEAALCRLPVIATDVGGTCEIIEDGVSGILVPTNNSAMIAHAVTAVLEHPEKAKQYAEKAYQNAVSTFSWEKGIVQYDRIIQTMI